MEKCLFGHRSENFLYVTRSIARGCARIFRLLTFLSFSRMVNRESNSDLPKPAKNRLYSAWIAQFYSTVGTYQFKRGADVHPTSVRILSPRTGIIEPLVFHMFQIRTSISPPVDLAGLLTRKFYKRKKRLKCKIDWRIKGESICKSKITHLFQWNPKHIPKIQTPITFAVFSKSPLPISLLYWYYRVVRAKPTSKECRLNLK